MKALSILQPWAWLICHADSYERPKRVENRDWRSPPSFRGRFLVHAGKKHDREGFQIVLRMRPDLGRVLAEALGRDEIRYGGIVGIAELAAVVDLQQHGGALPAGAVTVEQEGWAFGPLCFVLRNARPLPFVPCKGALGFFEVDAAAKGIAIDG